MDVEEILLRSRIATDDTFCSMKCMANEEVFEPVRKAEKNKKTYKSKIYRLIVKPFSFLISFMSVRSIQTVHRPHRNFITAVLKAVKLRVNTKCSIKRHAHTKYTKHCIVNEDAPSQKQLKIFHGSQVGRNCC